MWPEGGSSGRSQHHVQIASLEADLTRIDSSDDEPLARGNRFAALASGDTSPRTSAIGHFGFAVDQPIDKELVPTLPSTRILSKCQTTVQESSAGRVSNDDDQLESLRDGDSVVTPKLLPRGGSAEVRAALRSPNAPKFEDRSQETEWQEQSAREEAWKLAKSVLKIKGA